jgi:hypothetical protein
MNCYLGHGEGHLAFRQSLLLPPHWISSRRLQTMWNMSSVVSSQYHHIILLTRYAILVCVPLFKQWRCDMRYLFLFPFSLLLLIALYNNNNNNNLAFCPKQVGVG